MVDYVFPCVVGHVGSTLAVLAAPTPVAENFAAPAFSAAPVSAPAGFVEPAPWSRTSLLHGVCASSACGGTPGLQRTRCLLHCSLVEYDGLPVVESSFASELVVSTAP